MKNKYDWDSHEFSCHNLGEIMTRPKGSEVVSEGAKTALFKLYDEKVYGIKVPLTTKEMRKGLMCEQDSITLLNRVYGTYFSKNELQKGNGWVRGTADVVGPKVVIDVKTAWDITSFRKAVLTANNKWQMVAYLWLWDRARGYVAYCLVSTPEEFIMDAKRQLAWQMGMIDDTNPEYIEAEQQLERSMTYDHIDEAARVRAFPVDLFEEEISLVKERIMAARAFLKSIPDLERSYGLINLDGKPLFDADARLELALKAVCDANSVSAKAVLGASRKAPVMLARHQYRALSRTVFSSIAAMGAHMGLKAGTIRTSLKTHETLMNYDTQYNKIFEKASAQYDRSIC